MNKFLITIVGPTAIGKTSLAIKLAKHYKTEIISADSRQFYKELNIGTAKPSREELSSVKHHLINNISVTENYDISQFQSDATEKINNLFKINDFVIMVGGSGLYIDSVLYGIDDIPKIDPSVREKLNKEYKVNGLKNLKTKLKKLDPITYKKIDLNNNRRIIRALEVSISSNKPYSSFLNTSKIQSKYNEIIIGLDCDRPKLHYLINSRVDIMIKKGLIDEVNELVKYKKLNALNTIGYKEIFEYLENKINFDKAIEKIKTNSRRYAKRQLTWFKSNKKIHWYDIDYDVKKIIKKINKLTSIQQST